MIRLLPAIALLFAADIAVAQFVPTTRATAPRIGPFVPAVGPRQAESWRETRDIRHRIEQGRDAGQLSRRDARRLRRAAGGIDGLAGRYAADGLSDAEIRELAVRTHVLRDEVLARRSGVDLRGRPDQRGR